MVNGTCLPNDELFRSKSVDTLSRQFMAGYTLVVEKVR